MSREPGDLPSSRPSGRRVTSAERSNRSGDTGDGMLLRSYL